jgi:hypothetical protein
MSYTELNTGRLKPLQKHLTIEGLEKWLSDKKDLFIDDFEDKKEEYYEFFEIRDKNKKYKEPMYIKYIYNKGTLYEMIQHSSKEANDTVSVTNVNSDGTIDFVYMFYNGGTCFSEMLEKGLNKI